MNPRHFFRLKNRLLAAIVAGSLLAVAAQAQTAAPADAPPLTSAELDQATAPIALYPDPLLTKILMAATYPTEVVEADRWVKAHSSLQGDALAAEAAKESWDDSVKGLVIVPGVLAMMSEQLDWTEKLGNAVLAQQQDVMDSIQRLRKQAQATGALKSSPQQTVSAAPAPAGSSSTTTQYITIQPTQPQTVYVPYYNPTVVYGTWAYPSYPPPYYPPPPSYPVAGALVTGLAFGTGVAIAHSIWDDDDFNWGHGDINVNVNKNINVNNFHGNGMRPGAGGSGTAWQHNPAHRGGVPYRNAGVQQRYQNRGAARNTTQARANLAQHNGAIGGSGGVQRHAATSGPGRRSGGVQHAAAAAPGRNGAGTYRPAAARAAGNPGGNLSRPSAGGGAFGNIESGSTARANADRGRASLGNGGVSPAAVARPAGGIGAAAPAARAGGFNSGGAGLRRR
ncbi:MAG: DUF3300 domain-containing protein [Alphaproteobacteria bacterium]